MTDDHALARTLTTDAGALLLELRAGAGPDADPKVLRKAGDARSHDLLMAALAEHRPHPTGLT